MLWQSCVLFDLVSEKFKKQLITLNSDIDGNDQPQAINHDSEQAGDTSGHFLYFDHSEEHITQRDLNTINHTRTGENR